VITYREAVQILKTFLAEDDDAVGLLDGHFSVLAYVQPESERLIISLGEALKGAGL